jgi:hypothetical protein
VHRPTCVGRAVESSPARECNVSSSSAAARGTKATSRHIFERFVQNDDDPGSGALFIMLIPI